MVQPLVQPSIGFTLSWTGTFMYLAWTMLLPSAFGRYCLGISVLVLIKANPSWLLRSDSDLGIDVCLCRQKERELIAIDMNTAAVCYITSDLDFQK